MCIKQNANQVQIIGAYSLNSAHLYQIQKCGRLDKHPEPNNSSIKRQTAEITETDVYTVSHKKEPKVLSVTLSNINGF